jgi:hypothetical protein
LIRRLAIAALVVPAYTVAGLVMAIFLVVLAVVVGARVVEAVSDYGHSYSIATTRRCLEERGRDVKHHPAGSGFGELEVTYKRGGVTEWTSLWFAPTPAEAKHAEVADSERSARRGNVLFQNLVAGSTPSDPAIDECLDQARTDR